MNERGMVVLATQWLWKVHERACKRSPLGLFWPTAVFATSMLAEIYKDDDQDRAQDHNEKRCRVFGIGKSGDARRRRSQRRCSSPQLICGRSQIFATVPSHVLRPLVSNSSFFGRILLENLPDQGGSIIVTVVLGCVAGCHGDEDAK